jgi:hypothetical protein
MDEGLFCVLGKPRVQHGAGGEAPLLEEGCLLDGLGIPDTSTVESAAPLDEDGAVVGLQLALPRVRWTDDAVPERCAQTGEARRHRLQFHPLKMRYRKLQKRQVTQSKRGQAMYEGLASSWNKAHGLRHGECAQLLEGSRRVKRHKNRWQFISILRLA